MADSLFINRVAYLSAKLSKEGVADYYGVTTETVSKWIKGNNSPRSSKTRTSIINRGKKIAGKSGYVNTATGRIKVNDGSTFKAVGTINESRQRLKTAALRLATNDRQRKIANREYKDLTEQEIRDLERKFNELQKNRALGKEEASESAGQVIKREYATLKNPSLAMDEEEEEISRPISRKRKLEAFYISKRGMRKKVYRGSRSGLYYKEPSGRKVYISEQKTRGVKYAKNE